MKHPRLILLPVFAALALTLVVGLDLHAQSSASLPTAADQGSGSSHSGATTAALSLAPEAAPAAFSRAPGDLKFKNWTASKDTVRVYPQPSARAPFMHDERYVDEQTIKVLEIVPGRNKLSWLKVLTPANRIGYVFSGEARPANVSRSGKLVQSPTMDD